MVRERYQGRRAYLSVLHQLPMPILQPGIGGLHVSQQLLGMHSQPL